MQKSARPTRRKARRRNERGAALISVLLISLLLLSAGGALVLTTSMSATNSIDATAEMQAYYGAEAGMQAALNVLRGNVEPHTPMSNGGGGLLGGILGLVNLLLNNTLTFLGAVTPVASNLDSDPITNPDGTPFPNRLSRWLLYDYRSPGFSYNDRVRVTSNYGPLSGAAYSVTVRDPDNTPAGVQPARILIESTGYGPRGAQKKLSAIISRYALDIPTPALLTIRGHDDGATNMTFTLGNSYAKRYSGIDRVNGSGGEGVKPAFAVSLHDAPVAQQAYEPKPETVDDPKMSVIPNPNPNIPPEYMSVETPWFLRTTADTRAFLAQAKSIAQLSNNIYDGSRPFPGTAGTTDDPVLSYVDGDCTLDGGAGLLIVTGKLTMRGNPRFDGVILVLGKGEVERSGGGTGYLHGAMMIAKFDPKGNGDFLAPKFETDGAGASEFRYDSRAIEAARTLSGHPLLGIYEK